MSVYGEDPETGLPREKPGPGNELRVLVLSQLRTYPPGGRGPDAKSISNGLSSQPGWRAVLAVLRELQNGGLAEGRVMSGAMHWHITAAGRRALDGR